MHHKGKYCRTVTAPRGEEEADSWLIFYVANTRAENFKNFLALSKDPDVVAYLFIFTSSK